MKLKTPVKFVVRYRGEIVRRGKGVVTKVTKGARGDWIHVKEDDGSVTGCRVANVKEL